MNKGIKNIFIRVVRPVLVSIILVIIVGFFINKSKQNRALEAEKLNSTNQYENITVETIKNDNTGDIKIVIRIKR